MKLPGRTEGAVQELVGVDPGVYAQRGQAVAQLGGAVSAIATDWEERTGNARAREALVEMSNNLTEFRTRYGNQRTFTAKEIETMGGNVPDEQRYREWTDDAGNVQREEKSEFDAEDFYPAALKHKWEAEAQLQAKHVPGSQRRAEFLAHQQAMINKSIEQEVGRAQTIREQKLNTRFEVDIQNAEISGNYEVARMLISQHPTLTPEQKDAEQLRLHQAEEQRQLFQLRNTDIYRDDGSLNRGAAMALVPQLEGQIKRLKSPIYGGDAEGDRMNSLTKQQRQAEITSLSSQINGLRSALKGDTKQAESAGYIQIHQAVDAGTPLPQLLNMVDSFALQQGLSGGAIKSLRDYVKDGAKYDPTVVSDLHSLAEQDPGTFVEDWDENREVYRMHMPPDMFEELEETYGGVRHGSTEVLADKDYMSQLIKASGIDTKGDPDDDNVIEANRAIADFRAYASKLIRERERADGRKLTAEERRVAIREARDATLTQALVHKPKEFDVEQGLLNDIEVTRADVPDNEFYRIRDQLVAAGKTPTTDQITEIYADIQLQKAEAEKAKAKRIKDESEAEEREQIRADRPAVFERMEAEPGGA